MILTIDGKCFVVEMNIFISLWFLVVFRAPLCLLQASSSALPTPKLGHPIPTASLAVPDSADTATTIETVIVGVIVATEVRSLHRTHRSTSSYFTTLVTTYTHQSMVRAAASPTFTPHYGSSYLIKQKEKA